MARMKSKPTLDELESERVRAITRASRAERDRDRLYEKLRRLENAVRKAAGDETISDPRTLLVNLARRVPVEPRPTLYMIRQERYRRQRERREREAKAGAKA